MEIILEPSWMLTTDHSASSYGQPVLVNRHSNEAFGPGDIVRPYPSWDFTPAAMAVTRMMKTHELSAEDLDFCKKFIG